ncbi:HPr family phosphocarrier protein [[Clostridium] spiroforme]|nr:HPr family phosphocarrier protein [Thomasclavelia spiroformis]MBM6881115.1 HPr family phosphocarrier protein [Thomasclavelia spiroformis]MBM6931134.1 HPr family phosphocarrier protein [Thomasclavelia spiroformis]
MKEINYVVKNALGIHARPAALLAQCCVNFKSSVTIVKDDKEADGDNVLQILALGAKQGDTLKVIIDGEDEEKASQAINELLHGEFEEKKKVGILKIAFFGTKDYDRTFFSELVKDKGEGTYNSDIKYFDSQLGPETAMLAKGYDAVCAFVNDNLSRPVIETLHDCGVRLILMRCAGFNNIDLQAAKEYGITILRVPAYSPYAVAEHAMAILQEANRRLHKAYTKVKDNNFALSGLLGLDLHNKVAGIMGTGKIGICMARICKGYGMTVLGWDAYPNQALVDEGLLTYVDKEELLRRSDLISLHCPLIMGDGGTYHMINDDTIAMMKDTAMIVNTGRGPLIDPEALIRALKKGKFHAVALDVYEGEDNNVYTDRSDIAITNDITARLTMFPQLVLTSHQAFFTREALQAIAVVTMENARNFNEGNDYGNAEVKAK